MRVLRVVRPVVLRQVFLEPDDEVFAFRTGGKNPFPKLIHLFVEANHTAVPQCGE